MTGDGAENALPVAGTQRLDKWLWFARIVKSRTLAASLVTSGRVRVNRVKAMKPSQLVKPGDVITSSAQREIRVFRVLAPGKRRGPAPEAATLFEELTALKEADPAGANAGEAGRGEPAGPSAAPLGRLAGAGRPTKRDRRQIDRLRGRD